MIGAFGTSVRFPGWYRRKMTQHWDDQNDLINTDGPAFARSACAATGRAKSRPWTSSLRAEAGDPWGLRPLCRSYRSARILIAVPAKDECYLARRELPTLQPAGYTAWLSGGSGVGRVPRRIRGRLVPEGIVVLVAVLGGRPSMSLGHHPSSPRHGDCHRGQLCHTSAQLLVLSFIAPAATSSRAILTGSATDLGMSAGGSGRPKS